MHHIEKELIADKVKSITGQLLGHESWQLMESDSFTDDLGADSIDCLEINLDLEKEFSISIPDEEYEKFVTIGDVVEYLDSVLNPVGI